MDRSRPPRTMSPRPSTIAPVSSKTRSEAAPASSALQWFGENQQLVVGRFVLEDPLVYSSAGTPADVEPSCIDTQLTLGLVDPGQRDVPPLGTYGRLDPVSRAAYLHWLANGRRDALAGDRVLMLYFHGLERRILHDNRDASVILRELVRLHDVYRFSPAFDGFVSRLVGYAFARAGLHKIDEPTFRSHFEPLRAGDDRQHVAIGLAWHLETDRPLPASWALRVAKLESKAARSIVFAKAFEPLFKLFFKKYQERFGAGMRLRATGVGREVIYIPANSSIPGMGLTSRSRARVVVREVSGVDSQFAPVMAIWAACLDELSPLAKVLTQGVDVTSYAAHRALPDVIQCEFVNPAKLLWDELVLTKQRDNGVSLVTVGQLAEALGFTKRTRLTRNESRALSSAAREFGIWIEPDYEITRRIYDWAETVALHRAQSQSGQPVAARYLAACHLLELGAHVFPGRGQALSPEIDQIMEFVTTKLGLGPVEIQRLDAFRSQFLARTGSLAGVASRLQTLLTDAQREGIGHFLVGVVAARGALNWRGVCALQHAYKILRIDPASLRKTVEDYRLLLKQPVEIQASIAPLSPGEPIPSRAETSNPPLCLNDEMIKKLLRETHDVALMLSQIVYEHPDLESDDEDFAPAEDSVIVASAVGSLAAKSIAGDVIKPQSPDRWSAPLTVDLVGLDARYGRAVAQLSTRSRWSRAEFEVVARSSNLMPSSLFDVVNEWAIEAFGDMLVEEQGDDILCYVDLIAGPK
jgi:DNA-directed RNA polymerase subunit F